MRVCEQEGAAGPGALDNRSLTIGLVFRPGPVSSRRALRGPPTPSW